MIDLVGKTIDILPKGKQNITSFQVWFATPFGLVCSLDEAISHCVANDIDPNMNLHALPVALTEDSYEVLK